MSSDTTKPSASNPRKRPADDGNRTPVVLAVAAPDADTNEQKKQQQQQLFQRLWSEDNEIELIQGMINYVNQKAKDPLADVTDFHHFVNGSLHVDVNDRQVLSKARRLKSKFENNAAKVESRGTARSFSNPHESKMYELSKKLWGNDNNNDNNNNNNNNNNNDNNNNGNKSNVVSANVTPRTMGWMIRDEGIIKKGWELVSPAKKVELEAKWKNLKVQELEYYLKKVDVLKEQAEVVLDAISKI